MNAKDCMAYPDLLSFNGEETETLLGLVQAGVKKFIYLSTVHVYSSPLPDFIQKEIRTTNIPMHIVTLLGKKKL